MEIPMMKTHLLDRSVKTALVACASAALVLSTGIAPASAQQETAADEISELVASVAPSQGEVQRTDPTPSGFLAGDAGLPNDTSEPVVVTGGDIPLAVSLPAGIDAAVGEQAADGTVVYQSASDDIDVAAQVLGSGVVRIQTVIHDATAQHEFEYSIGNGYTPVTAADGSFWAYRFDERGSMNLYRIGEPWARDATGAVVGTHYEIRDDTIVQVVTPDADTVYPIVADPTWEWYNAAYGAGFSKRETRDLANLGGIAGLCSGLWRWPALGAACGIAGFQWWTQAGLAANANGCVFIAAVPAPLAVRWLSNKCR